MSRAAAFALGMGVGSLVCPLAQLVACRVVGKSWIYPH